MAERHIVIVGGGIIGSSTAYFLTRHPQFSSATTRVTLVEGSGIAAGASGKAGGLLALDWHGTTTASLAALSYKLHRSLAEEHGGASRWQYRRLTTLSVQADFNPSDMTSSRKKSAKHLSWLDDTVLRGSDTLGTPDTTAQVHPYMFTTSIAKLAEESGVKIVTSTVDSLVRHSSSSGGPSTFDLKLKNPDSDLSGVTDLVICAGPWTGSLSRKLGLNVGRAASIDGSRAHSVVLSPGEHGELPAQALFTAIKEERGQSSEPEIYNRCDNTAYACGPTDDSSLPATAAEVKVDQSAIDKIVGQVSKLSPLLSKATRVVEQACYLPVGSRGGDPVIGKLPNESNVYVGAGHSCWGITNGPGSGKCLAELILDGKVSSAKIDRLRP